jgi:hypothetical protein
MGKLAYSEKEIASLIQGIENGTITELNLPVGYYKAFAKYLSGAVMEGFGAAVGNVSTLDIPILNELLTNTYIFSAAKTFQMTKEITGLLVDENGDVRSMREFTKLARGKYDDWNEHYGRTEYNTAISQADNAAKWKDIEEQKDLFPMLQYSAIGDACVICRPLDGITAGVNDAIWNKIAPINHFNCKCLLKQRDGSYKSTEGRGVIVDGVVDKMKEKKQDMFINNSGKTGEIFTKEHPYYDVAKEYREYAKKNFNLPIPKQLVEQ